MIYAVVDIGSNTIRLQLYQYKKGKIKPVISKKKTAGLISYKKNNRLNKKGIRILVSILKSFKKHAAQLKVEKICYFATASIRNLENADEIKDKVKEKLDIEIDILSSSMEAKMSFSAVKNSGNLSSDNGILCDVGGGSSEVVHFENKKPTEVISLDIGSLSTYYDYVSLMLPSDEECENIRKATLKKLNDSNIARASYENLFAVGGTIRAIKKVLENVNIKKTNDNVLTIQMLNELQQELNGNNKEVFVKVLQVKAERIHTLVPGLVIIKTIAEYFNIKNIYVSNKTVREGVIYSIIKKDEHDRPEFIR